MSVTNKTIERLDCFSLVFGQNIVKQYRAFVYRNKVIIIIIIISSSSSIYHTSEYV